MSKGNENWFKKLRVWEIRSKIYFVQLRETKLLSIWYFWFKFFGGSGNLRFLLRENWIPLLVLSFLSKLINNLSSYIVNGSFICPLQLSWFSIDGEPFEARAITISLLPNKLHFFFIPNEIQKSWGTVMVGKWDVQHRRPMMECY